MSFPVSMTRYEFQLTPTTRADSFTTASATTASTTTGHLLIFHAMFFYFLHSIFLSCLSASFLLVLQLSSWLPLFLSPLLFCLLLDLSFIGIIDIIYRRPHAPYNPSMLPPFPLTEWRAGGGFVHRLIKRTTPKSWGLWCWWFVYGLQWQQFLGFAR